MIQIITDIEKLKDIFESVDSKNGNMGASVEEDDYSGTIWCAWI